MTKQSAPPEIIGALQKFDSPTISNAIEHFKVRDRAAGYASMALKCQTPRLGPMVGYAVTCMADTTTPGEKRPLGLGEVFDAIEAAPKPSILVIKHVGQDRSRSCFVGDMFCSAIQRLGAVGVVTDGGARDRIGINKRAPGFQLFCAGWVVSHGSGAFFGIGATVSVCGVTIEPGDLLHGDENGLLTIPPGIAEQVSQQAQAVVNAEAEYFDFVRSDEFSCQELKRRIAAH